MSWRFQALAHEVIKQFLSTERGKQLLTNTEAGSSDQQLQTVPPNGDVIPSYRPLEGSQSVKNGAGFGPSDDCSEILSSILE